MTARAIALLALLAAGHIVLGAYALAHAITFDDAPASFHVIGASLGCLCLVTAIVFLWLAGRLEQIGRPA